MTKFRSASLPFGNKVECWFDIVGGVQKRAITCISVSGLPFNVKTSLCASNLRIKKYEEVTKLLSVGYGPV